MAKLRIFVPLEKRTADLPPQLFVTVVLDSSIDAVRGFVPPSGTGMNAAVIRTSSGDLRRRENVPLIGCQPLRATLSMWENDFGVDFKSVAVYCNSVRLSSSKTPRQLHIESGCTLEIRKVKEAHGTGHEFSPAQFNAPTCCAGCKSFIWGIFGQGRRCTKCRVPVHHRCAETFNGVCEAELRQMFGIVNFNDADDEGEEEPVVAVIVAEADKAAFADSVAEVVEPECDPNFMKSLNRLSAFTDEQIQAIWLHYDKDESGTLDREEVKSLVCDLLSCGGLAAATTNAAEAEVVDRMIHRMDTNGDGLIQWEELWHVFKAAQDHRFLEQFKGIDWTTEKIYELWYHYDADQSGTLEADEVLLLLQDVAAEAGGVLDPSVASQMDSLLGPSRKIGWEEFYNILVPIIKGTAAPSRSVNPLRSLRG